MKYLFYILAFVGIGAVAVNGAAEKGRLGEILGAVGLSPNEMLAPERSIFATGLEPQIKLIETVASDNGWGVECKGRSGPLTVVALTPNGWFGHSSYDEMFEEVMRLSTGTNGGNYATEELESCDYPEEHFGSFSSSGRFETAVAVGTQSELALYLDAAKECEAKGLHIRNLTGEERQQFGEIFDEIPDDWLGLFVEEQGEGPFEPIACALQIGSYRNR